MPLAWPSRDVDQEEFPRMLVPFLGPPIYSVYVYIHTQYIGDCIEVPIHGNSQKEVLKASDSPATTLQKSCRDSTCGLREGGGKGDWMGIGHCKMRTLHHKAINPKP